VLVSALPTSMLADQLLCAGFDVDVAAPSSIRAQLTDSPDVVILSATSPDSGTVLRALRAGRLGGTKRTPVLVVDVGNDGASVEWRRIGADHALQGAGLSELIHTIGWLVTRGLTPVDVGNVVIDPARARVTINGIPVRLTRIQRRLLLTVARAGGRVVSHHDLITSGWPQGAATLATLRTHMYRLNKQLADHGATVNLVTAYGDGYQLAGTVMPGDATGRDSTVANITNASHFGPASGQAA